MALEDVADERPTRVAEAARAESLDEPREPLAEDWDSRVDGLGKGLVAGGDIRRRPVRHGLAAEDVRVAPAGRDGKPAALRLRLALPQGRVGHTDVSHTASLVIRGGE